MKRGQAAIEFLMTYGWAILTVMIVISALAYFGVLSPSQWMPTRCTLTGRVNCVDAKFVDPPAANSRLYLLIENNIQNDITITNLMVVDTVGNTLCSYRGAGAPLSVTIAPGERDEYSSGNCNSIANTNPGTRQKGTIVLQYTDALTGFEHEMPGTIIAEWESE